MTAPVGNRSFLTAPVGNRSFLTKPVGKRDFFQYFGNLLLNSRKLVIFSLKIEILLIPILGKLISYNFL